MELKRLRDFNEINSPLSSILPRFGGVTYIKKLKIFTLKIPFSVFFCLLKMINGDLILELKNILVCNCSMCRNLFE
jgi:hypothetical protein